MRPKGARRLLHFLMPKITINGLEIECDDNIELAIEGNKITIKAAPSEHVVHEHHYHYQTISTPPLAPTQPWIGTPSSPPLWPNITVSTGHNPDPPATGGFVSIQPHNPGFLPNGDAQALSMTVLQ